MEKDDSQLLSLDDAAALVPGADRNTLLRRARQGKLQVYRVGKAYCTTRADIWRMVETTRIMRKERLSPPPSASVAQQALLATVADLKAKIKAKRAEEKRLAAKKRIRST